MSVFRLNLFGGLELSTRDGDAIPIAVKKARALLAFLALHPDDPQPRDKLAGLLWADSVETAARHSLRQALGCLRKALSDTAEGLRAERETLALDSASFDVDVHAFERLSASRTLESLERMSTLYRGELLEGFTARAPAFDEWLVAERSRLHEHALEALQELLARYLSAGATHRALALATRLVTLDPLRESVHRTLMELHSRGGHYGAALKQFRRCRTILERELGVDPEPATEALYRDILGRRQQGLTGPGTGLESDGPVPPPAVAAPAMPPELRQVAVVCASLADFARIDATLEPEDAHGLLLRFYETLDQTFGSFGAQVASRAGDTVMAVFGVPRAQSSDVERAVRSASAIHEALSQLATPQGKAMRARIGVASGRVLASRPAGVTGYTVTGEPANQSRQLVAAAEPGQTLVSDAVNRSLAGRLATRAVTGAGALASGRTIWRIDSEAVSPDSSAIPVFVGRQTERHLFEAAIETGARSSRGQVFLLRGEAGIGKTRLLEEWQDAAAAKGYACLLARVLDFGTATGQDAIRILARGLLALPATASRDARDQALKEARAGALIDADEEVFLNDLLDLPQPDALLARYDAMENEARRRGRQTVLRRLLARRCEREPLLLAVEDIHWAGPGLLNELAQFARGVSELRAILVFTTRVEDEPQDPGWLGTLTNVPLTTLDLPRLRDEEAFELAADVVGEADYVSKCVQRAAGNPLFLEQLLRAARSGEDAIPDSVQSLVSARLDRLDRADKTALQAAAVIGQRFSLAVLRHLIEDPGYDCRTLVSERLVRPDGDDFLFVHALVQEGVYLTLLRSERQALHRRAAAWFALRDEVLKAQQLDRAEDPGAAVAYLAAATAQASAYRYELARKLLERGLALAREPAVLYGLGCAHGDILRASGDAEASIAAFQAALDHASEPAQRSRALIGVAAGLRILDHHTRALEVLEEAEALAARLDDAEPLARIHCLRGNLLFPLGRLEGCRRAHDRALAYAREAGSASLEARALSGLGDAEYQRGRMLSAHAHFDRCVGLCRKHRLGRIEAANRAMRGVTLFYMNRPEEALAECRAAADVAALTGNLRDRSLAYSILSLVHSFCGDRKTARTEVEHALELARRVGSRRFEAEALCDMAALEGDDGRCAEAVQLLESAYALSRESGLSYGGPWILGTLARFVGDAKRRKEALEEGEALLREGSVSHNHLHFYHNAIEACLQSGAWEEAERYSQALRTYTRSEPLPWSEFFVQRGRALASFGRGQRTPALRARLEMLSRQAQEIGFVVARERLETALAVAWDNP